MSTESVGGAAAGRRRSRGTPPRAGRRLRPLIESLEGRSLMTGNLSITGAQLVDASDQPVAAPVVGEEVFVEARWESSGLSASDRYTVRFSVDGVALDSSTIDGQAGDSLPFHWYIGGWFAAAGPHTVKVTVDPDQTVAETTYGDNTQSFNFTPVTPSTLPQPLSLPVAGVPFRSWSIGNYIDVNPLPGQADDYRGGAFVYDGHNGYDLTLPDFARMDAGVPVLAAAGGTITQVVDGNFDRQTAFNPDPANEVVEDLGSGWTAEYLHFMRDSITVRVGQAVQAGQVLGLVGSSGNSTDAHLHFDLRHDGDLVETFDDPSAYWIKPLPYQGDVSPTITDLGTTSADPTADMKERPASVTTFPSSSDWSVWYWFDVSYLDPGSQMTINWYRPDGSMAASDPFTVSGFVDFGRYDFDLSSSPSTWAASPGTWQVATVVDGKELGRTRFDVTNGAGDPTIKLEQGSTYILDDRTTPIDFGASSQIGAGPELSFTVENIGSAPLATSGLVLPPGFTLVGTFPATIPSDESATFTLQLSAAEVGPQFGQVTFQTNDPDAPTFGFNVSGLVTGTPPAGGPAITRSGAALATGLGWPATALDPQATLTDSSPQGFAGGRLTVAMASGGTKDDRLSILDQGNNTGQIGFNGSGVYYGGTLIGTASIVANPATLSVALNVSATAAAVQALLDAVTYQNVSTAPTTIPRHVRFAVVDGAGLISNLAIEMVVNSGAAMPSAPPLPPPILKPAPTLTGPPPPSPGPPPGSPAPVSTPVGNTPPPAQSPTGVVPAKKKHSARTVHARHKKKVPVAHSTGPRGRGQGAAGRVKNRGGNHRKRRRS